MALQTSLLYVTSKDNEGKQHTKAEQCLSKLEDFVIDRIVKIEVVKQETDDSKREKIAELNI